MIIFRKLHVFPWFMVVYIVLKEVAVLNHNGGPGYEDIFTPDPAGGDTCAEAGVLGMLPAIIGNIQALEAVKIIIGLKPNLSGKLLLYDGITHETNTIDVGANI